MRTADALLGKAEYELRARRLDIALELFVQAEEAGGDEGRCSGGRWMAHMLRGDFEYAWLENDAFRKRNAMDPHRMWEGQSLAGKRVMLRCLHGFGDAVQFLRYVPLLREIAAEVILEVAPRFVELAACFHGVSQVITWGRDAPAIEPLWDEQIEVMELPYFFRTTASDLPVAKKYLTVPCPGPETLMKDNGHLRVGLAWKAGEWNKARSLPLALLSQVLSVDGCEFWSLQGLEEGCDGMPMQQNDCCRSSLAGLAATIAQLDIVITVDTLAAHLAGALGTPAWVMLQHEADWRWLHEREDSPWYSSLRLFRQTKQGDWSGVMERICECLIGQRDSFKNRLVA